MSALVKDTSEFVKLGLKDNAFYRSLAFGILFSFVMTLIIGTFIGTFALKGEFPWLQIVSQQYWVGIFFITLSLVVAFGGYVSELRAREDILTPLRKKLVGTWEVRAQTWKIESGKIEKGYVTSICEIGIDSFGRKLYLHFRIRNSDVFRDGNLEITTLNIQYQTEPKKLIYFWDSELELKQPLSDGSGHVMQRMSFPFVTVLDFRIENEEVNRMTGYWYDINNSLFNLATRMKDLQGIEELKEAVSRGAITFRGDLEFMRWEKPKSVESGN